MPEVIFNVVVLRAGLGRLDLAEVAKRTLEVAEDYMPGCAWLDERGEVHYAETMSEVDGLVLCQAREPTETTSLTTAAGLAPDYETLDCAKSQSDLKLSSFEFQASQTDTRRTINWSPQKSSRCPPGTRKRSMGP